MSNEIADECNTQKTLKNMIKDFQHPFYRLTLAQMRDIYNEWEKIKKENENLRKHFAKNRHALNKIAWPEHWKCKGTLAEAKTVARKALKI